MHDEPRDRDRAAARSEAEERQALLEAFCEGFTRSRKGNLWRLWDDGEGRVVNLTVFWNRGGFVWCIASADDPRYSADRYETEIEAIEALWWELYEGGL
jgi:hypothetical protein